MRTLESTRGVSNSVFTATIVVLLIVAAIGYGSLRNAGSSQFHFNSYGGRTRNRRIYAAGDCVSKRLMLETLAAREGVVAASNIMGEGAIVDYQSTPWAVFTNPQIAAVGVTEEEFVRKSGACSCRVVRLSNVSKATMLGEREGLVKLVIDPSNGKVIGLHILSPSATEYVLEGAYAIKYGLTFEDIVNTTHIFPTLAEGVKLAAQSFVRDIAKMSCCVE